MTVSLTIDRFEGENTVLKSTDGLTVIWPKKNLPPEAKEGSVLSFEIKTNEEAEREQKKMAKDILNELLDTG